MQIITEIVTWIFTAW